MRMDGLSDIGGKRAEDSRRLDSSGVSVGNLRVIGAGSIRYSGNMSNEAQLTMGRTGTQLGVSMAFEDGDIHGLECNDIRLDNPKREVTALECLHIFRQIAEVVNLAHPQGIVVQNVRPSCFVMTSSNYVSFIESASCSDSSDEDVSNSQTEFHALCHQHLKELQQLGSQLGLSGSRHNLNRRNASEMVSRNSFLQLDSDNVMHVSFDIHNAEQTEEKKPTFPMKPILTMEANWYTSPEEVAGAPCSSASEIFQLGILLFELYSTFSSAEGKALLCLV